MSLDELKTGFFYSNGAYGRTWGVRQLAHIATDAETGETVVHFKGIAGTCRRKKGHCSPAEFTRWAKYQVALQENDWKRIGGDAPPAESKALNQRREARRQTRPPPAHRLPESRPTASPDNP